MPTGDGWPETWIGNSPPPPGAHIDDVEGDNADLSCRDEGQQNCGKCHLHKYSFAMLGGCLDCHTTWEQAESVLGVGNALFPDNTEQCMQTDSQFDGIGAVAAPALLSQHNIADSAAECRKCHGRGHPGDSGLLVYPDDVEGTDIRLGDPIPRSANKTDYQEFCLACHDGKDVSTSPLPDTKLGGPIPDQQVGPSSRSDPAAQQSSPPREVPAVPPKDVNAAAPSYATQTPFFQYYETNGHGRGKSMNDNPMDVTCLAGGLGQGCHAAHGSKNRFLLDELFGEGLDTASEVAMFVCHGCHSQEDLADPFLGGETSTENTFHTFLGSDLPTHDKGNGMAPWNETVIDSARGGWAVMVKTVWPFAPPPVSGAPSRYAETGILPFYGGPDAKIEARVYAPTLGTDHIHCLSCHDPHGTSLEYWRHQKQTDDTGTENTRGMPRKFATNWDYCDPLCWECHSSGGVRPLCE